MVGAERIRVVCTSCDWAGRRTSLDGACPRCGAALRGAHKHAPVSEEGKRVRVVVHVLPGTHDALEHEREKQNATGVGTIGSQVLDAWAERARKRK
jgi:hypothetical protein